MSSTAALPVAAMLDAAVRRLEEAGLPDPRREATALMALVLGTDRGGVAARKPDRLDGEAAARYRDLVAARSLRKPLQQLAGHAEFRGLAFAVTEDVLIPRPETEELVQAVLDAGLGETARVADLGTGSGCIAIALAVARPRWTITAVEASAAALAVARGNARRHGVSERIAFVESDFAVAGPAWTASFDAVVSNPPYVSESEWRDLQPEVRDHEPRRALVPGPTGHEAYAALTPVIFGMLAPGGLLAYELGWKSAPTVSEWVTAAGFHEIRVQSDVNGIARVLTARR